MASRRTPWLARGLFVLAIAVLVFLLTRSNDTRRPPAATTSETGTPAARAPAASRPPVATPQEPATGPLPGAKVRTYADRADFYFKQAEQYREQARYPKQNLALFTGQTDPIENDNGETIREKASGIDERVALVLKGPMAHAVYPDPIRVEAFVLVAGRPVPATLSGNFLKGAPNPFPDRLDLAFVDDGTTGDAVAGDLVYTWMVQPTDAADAERWAGFHNAYVTGAPADDPPAVVHSDVGWHYSAVAGARLTGRFRDAMVDGHLVIEAEMSVERAGRYHLQMSLHAPDSKPLAWSQNEVTADYAKGTHWVKLRVWGLLLRESSLDGPYTVARIWLRDVTVMPGTVSTYLENAYTTAAYRAADFSDASYDDPVDLAHAEEAQQAGEEILRAGERR